MFTYAQRYPKKCCLYVTKKNIPQNIYDYVLSKRAMTLLLQACLSKCFTCQYFRGIPGTAAICLLSFLSLLSHYPTRQTLSMSHPSCKQWSLVISTFVKSLIDLSGRVHPSPPHAERRERAVLSAPRHVTNRKGFLLLFLLLFPSRKQTWLWKGTLTAGRERERENIIP